MKLRHFKKEHPYTMEAIEAYIDQGRTMDDIFNDGLALIIKR